MASRRAPASPDFSGWNWVAAQRAVLDGRHETARRARSTSPRGAAMRSSVGVQRPAAGGVGVHEVEPLALHPGEQPGSAGDRAPCSSPCAAGPGPAAARPRRATPRTRGLDAVLDAEVEQHLHARRRCRAPARPPASRRPTSSAPLDLHEPAHAGREGADARHDQTVGRERGLAVGGDRRRRRRPARAPARPSARCPTRSRARRRTDGSLRSPAHSAAQTAGSGEREPARRSPAGSPGRVCRCARTSTRRR